MVGHSRADHAYRPLVFRFQRAFQVQHGRTRVYLPQRGGVVLVIPRQDLYPQSRELVHLRVQVQLAAHGGQVGDRTPIQSGARQVQRRRLPGDLQVLEEIQQGLNPHRPDPLHDIESYPILNIGHVQPRPAELVDNIAELIGKSKTYWSRTVFDFALPPLYNNSAAPNGGLWGSC